VLNPISINKTNSVTGFMIIS